MIERNIAANSGAILLGRKERKKLRHTLLYIDFEGFFFNSREMSLLESEFYRQQFGKVN